MVEGKTNITTGTPASTCDELPQEEVWAHQPAAPKEEAEVDDSLRDGNGRGGELALFAACMRMCFTARSHT